MPLNSLSRRTRGHELRVHPGSRLGNRVPYLKAVLCVPYIRARGDVACYLEPTGRFCESVLCRQAWRSYVTAVVALVLGEHPDIRQEAYQISNAAILLTVYAPEVGALIRNGTMSVLQFSMQPRTNH